MKLSLALALLSFWPFPLNADTVFTQPPDGTGALIASSWLDPNGSDADMYAYDNFMVASNTPIMEVRWRGGYIYGAPYGHATNFTITFFDSIAGGSQPHVNNPQLPEIYLAKYAVAGNAGETNAGTFGGTPMYDYRFGLPTPFQAAAGTKYWVRIEAAQIGYPDWGIAVGTGGDGQHFAFSTGLARFFYGAGDEAFTLLAPPGPYMTVATSAAPDTGGSTSGGGVFTNGSSVTLVATAVAGFAFVNWTQDGAPVSASANYTFTVTSNRTLVAHFAPAFTVTTSPAPAAGGTTTGDGSYTYGSSVTVSATANANYCFVNWTEGGIPVSVAADYTFNAGANRALVANFVPANPNVTAVVSQPHDGSGTINKSAWYAPNGLDGDEYAYDSFLLSSNQPITRITWRGGYTNYKQGAGKSPVYDFTVCIYPSIPAGVQPDIIAGPLVTYDVGGNAGETLAGTIGGTDMYDYDFVLPTTFNAVGGAKYWLKIFAWQGLTPFPAYWPPDWGFAVGTGGDGTRFDEVTGGTLGGGTLYYIATGDTTFTLFGPAPGRSITTIASPAYGGSVSGGGIYTNGASVSVTAIPSAGHVFVSWNENGLPISFSTNYAFTATADHTLVAEFAEPYTITASASPAGGGTTSGSGTYLSGTNVTLIATPNPGYAFVNWTDTGFAVCTSPTYYFTADANYALVANFAPVCTITTGVLPANGGFASGGGTFLSGASVTLAPTPNAGYAFVNWTENGAAVCSWPDFTLIANTNRTLIANFASACAITTASASTNGLALGGGSFPSGAAVTVLATPKTGYAFANWTENGTPVSLSPAYSFIANSNRTLVATFTPDNTTVLFDFDSALPVLTNAQALPFDQTSGGLTAHFSSSNLPAFWVQNDSSVGWRMSKFSAQYLFPRLAGRFLDLQFSQPLGGLTLTFATTDFQQIVVPTAVQLSAYKDSTAAPPVATATGAGSFNAGDPMPMGTLSVYANGQTFNAVRVEVPLALTDFLVDNIVATTIPRLAIRRTATNTVVVSWPAPSAGYVLQHTPALGAATWTDTTNFVSVVGPNNEVIVGPLLTSEFFRLFHP